MNYLLDSSAWLAHLFGEPGMEQVNHLFDDSSAEISISALSLIEVYARLKSMNRADRWPEVWDTYSLLFTKVLPADETVAHQAIALREATQERLPTVDGLIAATTVVQGLTLVHLDPHLAAIPVDLLKQIQLPDNK